MAIFICTRKCWHGGKLYQRGEPAKFTEAINGPHPTFKKGHKKGQVDTDTLIHFEKVDSLPVSGNDRVGQMESEVAKLTKMVATLTPSDDESKEEPAKIVKAAGD